jgi:hypothetical protein
MVLTVAISCVNDYVSGCLHKSRVVHERGKRNQTQMACYIYFSGKGQTVATVEQYRLFGEQYRQTISANNIGEQYRRTISANNIGDLFQIQSF